MIDNRYLEQITDYIENTLNKSDKTEFELYMSKDSEFKKIVEDIKLNTLALKRLDDIEMQREILTEKEKELERLATEKEWEEVDNDSSK